MHNRRTDESTTIKALKLFASFFLSGQAQHSTKSITRALVWAFRSLAFTFQESREQIYAWPRPHTASSFRVWFTLSHVIARLPVEFCSRTLLVWMRSHAVKCIQVCSFFVAVLNFIRWLSILHPASTAPDSMAAWWLFSLIMYTAHTLGVCAHWYSMGIGELQDQHKQKIYKTTIAQCKAPIGFSNRTHQKNIGYEFFCCTSKCKLNGFALISPNVQNSLSLSFSL